MQIKLKTWDGKRSLALEVSKLDKVETISLAVEKEFGVPRAKQRLFYSGKQLDDHRSLFDYNVKNNDVIQVMERLLEPPSTTASTPEPLAELDPDNEDEQQHAESRYFKIGDFVYVRDTATGAWEDGKIVAISHKEVKGEEHPSLDPEVEGSPSKGDDSPHKKQAKVKDSTEAGESSSRDLDDSPKKSRLSPRKAQQSSSKMADGDTPSKSKASPSKMDLSPVKSSEGKEEVESDIPSTSKTSPSKDNKSDLSPSKAEGSCSSSDTSTLDDGLLYKVLLNTVSGSDQELSVSLLDLHQCATRSLRLDELKKGMMVLVNYNPESFSEPGGWYEMEVTLVKVTRTGGDLMGTVKMGGDTCLKGCIIKFCHDTKPFLPLVTLEERDPKAQENAILLEEPCGRCQGNPTKKCKECSCKVCGGKDDPEQQILCDECNDAYHIGCLTPPLEALPTDDNWFCPGCKRNTSEIVAPGSELKESKRKAKMPSTKAAAEGQKIRDWGRGNATVGVTDKCTIVGIDHFGKIPNVEVGTRWKWRWEASSSGVHRPPVSGIHGRETDGAYSIVLNGGYEDDKDMGDSFIYTGSGGRDLSGNKRVAAQSCDQTLTKMNLALARNCAAPINAKDGAEAKNWKDGKEVRVLRGHKFAKHSKYAPKLGLRYDGTYKVVRYFKEVGKSGFKVWRYELRRDDPTPAPWTAAGKKFIEEHGLQDFLFPDSKSDGENKDKDSRKRKASETSEAPATKMPAIKAYKPDPQLMTLINSDVNEKLWAECIDTLKLGKLVFMSKVTENFVCVCCQELVVSPVTTPCCHNICHSCLKRSFDAKVYQCPCCRAELDKNTTVVNKVLSEILITLFPGYNKR